LAARSSLTQTWGEYIIENEILKFWPLFYIRMDKNVSAIRLWSPICSSKRNPQTPAYHGRGFPFRKSWICHCMSAQISNEATSWSSEILGFEDSKFEAKAKAA